MSNVRNGYVNCHYLSNFHVDFKMLSCRMSNLRKGLRHVENIFFMSIDSMSHVDCKKWPCRPVNFKGQGPYKSVLILVQINTSSCHALPFTRKFNTSCFIRLHLLHKEYGTQTSRKNRILYLRTLVRNDHLLSDHTEV